MGYFPNDELHGLVVDLDSGTVFDIRSIVYVPMTEWEKVSKEFEYGHGHVGKVTGMSRVYSSIADLVMMELRPAIATDDTLTADQVEAIADEVCTRMQDAGLIVWDDGYSESLGAYWLPAQGFRLVDGTNDADERGEALASQFWRIVADVAEGVEQTN